MKLSDYSISVLKKLIVGDPVNGTQVFPYLKTTRVNELFNSFSTTKHIHPRDWTDSESGGILSRVNYAGIRLTELNNTPALKNLFERILQPIHFKGTDCSLEEAVNAVNEYITPDNYKVEQVGEVYKIIGEVAPDEIRLQVHFEEIQSQILEQIDKAKYSIWLAVAWFTDQELIKALYQKQIQGLDVRIIVFNDEINRNRGILHPDTSKYFNLYSSSEVSDKKLHVKFCIFDLKTVMQGSYNWTLKAMYNHEDIATIQSREIAEEYADQFIKLKLKASNISLAP